MLWTEDDICVPTVSSVLGISLSKVCKVVFSPCLWIDKCMCKRKCFHYTFLELKLAKPALTKSAKAQILAGLAHATAVGVVNGKIRDSPRRRDPCLKIRARDFNHFRKSEPETQCREIRARDFINHAKTNRVGEATIEELRRSSLLSFQWKKKRDRGMRERAQGPRPYSLALAVNEFPRFSCELDM